MDSPPELERIVVDTPPPSPISFADDSFDSIDTQGVVSPVKRTRIRGAVKHSKRRKKNNVPVIEPRLNDFVHDDGDDGIEVLPVDVDEAPKGGYAGYVVGVADRLAGFFPLSDDLFVVQGWDDKSNGAKVRL